MKKTIFFALLLLLAAWTVVPAHSGVDAPGSGVLVVPLRGAINPAGAELVRDALARAVREDYHAVVLRLNTPGGLLSSTREIVESILNSTVPVIAFVAPAGAQCASAGTFIALACPVLAMAPGTNIGAAHPVTPFDEMDETMKEKALSDTVAWIKSLAARWDRDEDWAERAVRESVSANEHEALALGICDLVVSSVEELLTELDGRRLVLDGREITLATANAPVSDFPLGMRSRILQAISDPSIAYILLMLGILGIMGEFSSPGLGFPGVAGIISLLLAFYALAALPVTLVGVGFIIAGAAFLILEAYTPTFGLLGLGGIVSLFLASLFLIRPLSYLSFSRPLFYVVSASFALVIFGLASFAFSAHRRQVTTGSEGLIGERGRARTDLDPEGTVYVHGEYWSARAVNPPVRRGETVRVVRLEGRRLEVERESAPG